MGESPVTGPSDDREKKDWANCQTGHQPLAFLRWTGETRSGEAQNER